MGGAVERHEIGDQEGHFTEGPAAVQGVQPVVVLLAGEAPVRVSIGEDGADDLPVGVRSAHRRVPRLPRVKTERLPEGLHGNTVLSAVSIVIFYAIIQQAVYGPDDAASRKMPWLCVPRSASSALLIRAVRQSDHDRRSAVRACVVLVSALLNATFSVIADRPA
jgi:hypothetical protein